MNKLTEFLMQLENKISYFEASNPDISNGNVA
jgi:hypothetical protein